jgi:hypothetical protein
MELTDKTIQHLIVVAEMEDIGEMDAQDWIECMGERRIARLVLDDLGVSYND